MPRKIIDTPTLPFLRTCQPVGIDAAAKFEQQVFKGTRLELFR